MNAVIYFVNPYKLINGTLFYCFEYFLFLKTKIYDLQFLLLNLDDKIMVECLNIFKNKYNYDYEIHKYIKIVKRTDLIKYNILNCLILDINTLEKTHNFLSKSNIFCYSNIKTNIIRKNIYFYGFYDYQNTDRITRLKIFKEVHKTFEKKGNKILLTSLNYDLNIVINKLNLNTKNLLLKKNNNHNYNLFEDIYKIVYYHSPSLDKNNRLIVESAIHNIELEVHYNGFTNDSVFERHQLILNKNLDELFLCENDLLIKDFCDIAKL